VGQVSNQIVHKMTTMAKAEDPTELHNKRKIVATLLPYATRQERDGKPEMLNAFLEAARTSRMTSLPWRPVLYCLHTVLYKATPRAIVLVSPHIEWRVIRDNEDLAQLWVAAASTVQYTEEVARCVVAALLLIASNDMQSQYLTVDVWSWLTKRPSLPPSCLSRSRGSLWRVVKAVRGLGDIEILKSYLLITWSEWNALWSVGFDEMCVLLREDFGGVGMGHHRVDLIRRLDQILGQLDQGLESLERRLPNLGQPLFQLMKDQYGKLNEILLEINDEVIARTSYPIIMLPRIQTQVDVHRISRNIYVCAPFAMSIAPLPEPSASLIPPPPLHL